MRLKENEIIEKFRQEFDIKHRQVIDIGKYAPLIIKNIEREVSIEEGFLADAIIEFCIADGPCFKAMVEFKTVATPRIISQVAQQLKSYLSKIDDKSTVPVVIVPYMGTEQAKILQREGISWIDLCGNMMIKVDGKIYIERTGKTNQFPDTAYIKKIFEGTSSLVSRALLLKKEPYRTLYEIVNFINERNGNITLATVSKVIRSLEEDLFVTKNDNGISVINREKLLEKITEGYANYVKRNPNKTYTYAAGDYAGVLLNLLDLNRVDFALCGFFAAEAKGMATTDRFTIFIKSINEVKEVIENYNISIKPDVEFGNFDIIENRNSCVWFNLSKKGPEYCIVDDIELYLEMMIDTPRGPKVAEILKERILKGQE